MTTKESGGREREAENFRRIWLSPICCALAGEQRLWCQDDQGPCDDCGDESVEYVRGDIADALVKALEAIASSGAQSARNRDKWDDVPIARAAYDDVVAALKLTRGEQ